MLMALFILVLLVANIIVMCVILGSQRISSPRCGHCSAVVAGEGVQACPACRSSYLDVGIAAGSVMRPPPRMLLCLAGLMVAIACIPFLTKMTDSFEYILRSNGEWQQSNTVVLGLVPVDRERVHRSGRRVEISGVQVRAQPKLSLQVIEAWIELSVFEDDEVIDPPMRHQVLMRGGNEADVDLSVPFSSDAYLSWLKELSVFPDNTSKDQLETAVQCIEENIQLAFLGEEWGNLSVLTVKTPFTRVSSSNTVEPMPLPSWQRALILGLLVVFIVALVLGVLMVILRYTRQKEVAGP